MRVLFFAALVFILSCNAERQDPQQKNEQVVLPNYPLPVDKEISFDYNVHDQCTTYYYFAKDTLNPVLSRVIGFDEHGREKEIVYRGYESYIDATSLFFYDTPGRLSEVYYRIDDGSGKGDLTKTLYYYDQNDSLNKTVSFSYQRRLKKDVDKGIDRPGGCIILPEDYEKYRSWAVSSVWVYKYDLQGRLAEKSSPLGNTGQNRYLYKYDNSGRLIEEISLSDEQLIWVEKYKYYSKGHEYTRTWYENGGRRKDANDAYEPIDTFRYKADKYGNIAEELVIEEGGRQVSRHKKYYDDQKRIRRHEIFDEQDQLLGFYLHEYTSKKARGHFLVSSR